MKKRNFINICLLIIFLLISVLTAFRMLQKIEDCDYRQRGALLINKIEMFRQIKKQLPENVRELGLDEPMDQGPYYKKIDSVNYIVFFNIGFDHEVKIYFSNKKEWENGVLEGETNEARAKKGSG